MKKDFETDDLHNGKLIYCPYKSFDCPYCDDEAVCHIADPIEDCDEFGSVWDSWEDYDY